MGSLLTTAFAKALLPQDPFLILSISEFLAPFYALLKVHTFYF